MARQTVAVSGMSCTGCEQNIEEALGDLAGVSSAEADHEGGTVAVVLDESVSDSDIRAAVEEAGYEVTG